MPEASSAGAAAQIRAVLIDLDGTLMDTAPDLALAANRVRGEFGLHDLAVERIAQFVGKGTDMLVHRALTDNLHGQVGGEAFDRGKHSFERHYRDVNGTRSTVFDGVPEALRLLREAGLKVGCVTNKPREFTLALLQGAGLLAQLDAVAAGDEVVRRKPHPDLIELGCARLGVAPGQVVLLGDSRNDAQAALAASCDCLLVETGYNEGESVQELAGEPAVRGIFPSLLEAARQVIGALAPVRPGPGARAT
jgi:phosphoglycolate phosphatase